MIKYQRPPCKKAETEIEVYKGFELPATYIPSIGSRPMNINPDAIQLRKMIDTMEPLWDEAYSQGGMWDSEEDDLY